MNITLRSRDGSSPASRGNQEAADGPLEKPEHREAEQPAERQRQERGRCPRHDRREEEPGRGLVDAGQKCRAKQSRLARPAAAEVVRPGARLQVVVRVERRDDAGKREVDVALGGRDDFLPVAVLLVDVGARGAARRARRALRVRRVAQAARLGVQLLDDEDRADVVAPGLPGVCEADADRRGAQRDHERRDGVAVAVGRDEPQPQRDQKDAEGDVIGMRLQPRAGTPAPGPAESRRQLRDERERANPAPPVIAGEHEEERQRRDGDGPEDAAREARLEDAEDDKARKDDKRRETDGLDPPGIRGSRLRRRRGRRATPAGFHSGGRDRVGSHLTADNITCG